MTAALTPPWELLTRQVADRCERRGFDLVHPFNLRWHHEQLADPSWRLPWSGSATALALVVANTRALWSPFLAALRADPELARAAHPLDEYTVRTLREVASGLPEPWAVYFAHTLEPSPLPIQRIAQAAGFACLSPSHLSVHPEHGPWLALRAILVIEVEGPSGPPPRRSEPCGSCDKPCLAPLARALEEPLPSFLDDARARDWRAWVAIRDACPWGRASRYGPEQLEYHYTKRRSLLEV